MSLDLDELSASLASTELAVYGPALNTAAKAVAQLVSQALVLLETTTACFAVSQALVQFGPAMARPLEEEFGKLTDRERKTYAAMVLLYLGSQIGVDYLLQELAEGSEMAISVAVALSSARVIRAAPLIEARLFHIDVLSDPYNTASLISSLKKLRSRLSPELMAYLSRPNLPLAIQLAIADDLQRLPEP